MTTRDIFISHAARHLIEQQLHVMSRGCALTEAFDCTSKAIEHELANTAPWVARLSAICGYAVPCSHAGKRRALAKAIAGRYANHPNRPRHVLVMEA